MKTIILAATAALSLVACAHEKQQVERAAEVTSDNAKDASADAVAAGHAADNGMKTQKVGDLDLGRSLNEKGDIADRTQTFGVGDPIVASIDCDNLAAGTLTATLTDGSGKVIATQSTEVKSGMENATFKMGNAPAVGTYVLTVSNSGGEVEHQSFVVGGNL